MRSQVFINGKFLAGPATGVQRVAAEQIKALDRLLYAAKITLDYPEVILVVPKNIRNTIELRAIKVLVIGRLTGIPWEQIDLPLYAGRRLIVNLANLGPALSWNSVTMIHDAQTYSVPESYSFKFRKWYGFLQPLLGWRSKQILTVSEFSRTELIKYGIAKAGKITVIHNGVDHVSSFATDKTTARRMKLRERQFVLALSSTQPHKNIKVLLDAFSTNELAHLNLVVFGSTSTKKLEQFYGHPLPDNVKAIGTVSDAELAGLLSSALCLAFPSTTEGFGLPPLEAMYLGCPTIIAPCGALPEVCGDAALLANKDNPAEWRAKILELNQNNATWSNAQKSGLHRSRLFTWDDAARKLMAVIIKYG